MESKTAKLCSTFNNTSYLEYTYDQLTDRMPSDHSNMRSYTDLSSKQLPPHFQGLLREFMVNKSVKNGSNLMVFLHDYVYGHGQCSHLQSFINNINNASQTNKLVKKVSLKQKNTLDNPIVWLIDVLLNKQQFDGIIILDLYGLSGIRIRPFLLAISKKVSTANFLIYAHTNQQSIMRQCLQNIEYIELLHGYDVPFEASSEDLLHQFTVFMQENITKFVGNVQNVVIFNEITPEFIVRINYLLRINGFHNHCRIVIAKDKHLQQSQHQHDENISFIYLVNNTAELLSLSDDYQAGLNKVYLILDYGVDTRIYYDYKSSCFIEEKIQASHQERSKRINLSRGKISQYIYSQQIQMTSTLIQTSQIQGYKEYDLGNYYFLMIYLQLEEFLPKLHDLQVQTIQQLIKSIGKVTHQLLQIILLPSTYLAMTGLIYQLKKEKQNRSKHLADVLILAISVMTSQNLQQRQKITEQGQSFNLVQINQNVGQKYKTSNYRKPGPIWHQTGYIDSALKLAINLYNFISKNRQHEDFQSDFTNFKHRFEFSKDAYFEIINRYEELKAIYALDYQGLNNYQLTNDEFHDFLEFLVQQQKPSVWFFSGSRRLGYFHKGERTNYLLSKSSLTSQLAQRPSFIYLSRLLKLSSDPENPPQIIMCNNISEQVMLTGYGSLGNHSKQSFGQAQIEYHNVSSSIINHLLKYNGVQIENLEKEHQCSIQISEEMGTITVQCSKQHENRNREIFSELLNKLKDLFHRQSKIFIYSQTMKIVLGSGGQIQNLSVQEDKNEPSKIADIGLITNLSKQATLEDLKDLFDEFVQLKQLHIIQKQNSNQAIISFYSAQDLKSFAMYFNNCEYLGQKMYVQPYIPPPIQRFSEESYLFFEWNAWKSSGQGLVEFESEPSAKNAEKDILLIQQIDDAKVEIKRSGKAIFISKMSPITDEKYLFNLLLPHGKITKIQIKRSHFSETNETEFTVTKMINSAFKGDNVAFTLDSFIKGKNGHRSVKVKFQKQNYMKESYFIFNEIVGNLGKGRLYATIYFTYPFNVPQNNVKYIHVYQSILEGISEILNRPKMFDLEIIKNLSGSWIIIKSNQEAQIQIIKNMLFDALKGQKLDIKAHDSSEYMTDFALKSIMELQNRYPCKIVPDFNAKQIKALGRSNVLRMIEKEINTKMMKSFVCNVQLYNKAYKYIQKNLQAIKKQIDAEGSLQKIDLQKITKSINLIGKVDLIDQAKGKLGKVLQDIGKGQKSSHEQYSICGLCAEQYSHPYKLQACGHKFCFECLQQTIQIVSKDINLYPLKCPQCMQKIYICDLNNLISPTQWKNALNIAVNLFVSTHSDQYIFCFTAQCPQINVIEAKKWFRCRQCKKGYCLQCKNQYHPGISCSEARYGSDRMFDEFMKSVGGRICPRKTCKAPLWRISGCYKVLCAKCKASICFKCPENSMAFYETPQKAYDHLNKNHGGCF